MVNYGIDSLRWLFWQGREQELLDNWHEQGYTADDLAFLDPDSGALVNGNGEQSGTYALAALASAGADLARVIAHDTFDRDDSTSSLGTADSGEVWSALSGTWGIASNRGYVSTTTNPAVAMIEVAQSEVSVEASVLAPSAGGIGLIIRGSDVDNYLWADCVVGGAVRLVKNDAGAATVLAQDATWVTEPSTMSRLRIQAHADTIRVFVDGSLRVTHTLSAGDQTKFGAFTKVGLRNGASSGCRWDDFVVRKNV